MTRPFLIVLLAVVIGSVSAGATKPAATTRPATAPSTSPVSIGLERLRAAISEIEGPDKTEALRVLTYSGVDDDDGKPAVPALLKVLDHPDPEVRFWGSALLSQIDRKAMAASPKAAPNLPLFVERMKRGGDQGVMAVSAIAGLGPNGAPALPEVVRFMIRHLEDMEREGKSIEQRGWTGLYVAGVVIGMGEAAFPELAKLLTSDDAKVRCNAAVLLNNFTILNREEVDDDEVEDLPIKPPVQLPDAALEPLLNMLQSGEETDRHCAIPVLGNYGPRAKSAVPLLLPLLNPEGLEKALAAPGSEGRKRVARELESIAAAVKALHQIDRADLHGSDQLDELVATLGATVEQEGETFYTGRTLELLGPKAAAAVPAMLRFIAAERRRGEDSLLLFNLQRMDPAVIAPLTDALEDPDAVMRKVAAKAFLLMEPAPAAVLPRLEEVAKSDTDQDVRDAASASARRIREHLVREKRPTTTPAASRRGPGTSP